MNDLIKTFLKGGIASSVLFALPVLASAIVPGNPICVLMLGKTDTVLSMSGTASINLANCGLMSNSVATDSLSQVGKATVVATSIGTVGGSSGTGFTPLPDPFQVALEDPFKDFTQPTAGTCPLSAKKLKFVNESTTIDPGTYCGGVSITGGANITFKPGTYIFAGGDLTISGNSTVSGTGVTLYFTTDGKKYAGYDVSGDQTNVNLGAPTSGDLSGIAIFQDRQTPLSSVNRFTGGTVTVNGAIYTPTAALVIAGDTTVTSSQVVVKELDMTGNAVLHN